VYSAAARARARKGRPVYRRQAGSSA
jgi:hypothetical protein